MYRFGHGTASYWDHRFGERARAAQADADVLVQLAKSTGLSSSQQKALQDARDKAFMWRARTARAAQAQNQSIANFMTAVFDVIVLPEFDVRGMTRKRRSLSAKISRQMISLRFAELREMLVHLCTGPERKADLLYGVDESYTSKVAQ